MSDSEKTFTQAELNAAIQQAAVLSANADANNAQVIRARNDRMNGGGYDHADTLHNVFFDFGYPAELTFFNFWNMYRRFGMAKRVVNIFPEVTWITPPTIEANETFTRDLDLIIERLSLWQRVKGLDTRQRVGQYAGFFMRVKDGKKTSDPMEGKLNGSNALVDIMPLYESQLKPLDHDTDVDSPRFGQPTTYQFHGGSVGTRNPRETSTITIHYTRIVIAAEGADNGGIYGISELEAPYNSLMDARKIIGAGGEGFYKNAAQSIIFELKDSASASQNIKTLAAFNENYDDFSRNRTRRAIWTPGLTPTVLQSDLANPKEFLMGAINDIAAASSVPATILIGQQTGRLASSEDSRAMLSAAQSRRVNWVTELIKDTLDWFITYGILPSAEYTVEWDDLLALSDTEKLANVGLMADANQKQFQSGGQPVYSSKEMRDASGYEPEVEPDLEDDEGDEGVKDDDKLIKDEGGFSQNKARPDCHCCGDEHRLDCHVCGIQ